MLDNVCRSSIMISMSGTEKIDDYMTVAEAAEYLGVSPSTLRNWDRSGKLTARRHPLNGYRLYRREDLAQLLHMVANSRKERGQ